MEILCKGGKNPCYSDSVVRWDKELLPIKKITAHSAFSFIGLGINPTCHTRKTLTRLGNTSHEHNSPANRGAFYLERIRNEKIHSG